MVKEAVEEAKKAAEKEQAVEEAESAKEVSGEEDTCREDLDGGAQNTEEEPKETEDDETCEDGVCENDEKSGRKLFGKKNKKDKKDEKIEELTDRLTRQMAEFDNFRKRTDREKSQMYEIGAKDIIDKILPVVDNFERGLDAVKEDQKEDPFVQGMEKVYKQLMTTLEGVGVTPIEAVGKEFNPDFHNAVMHVEDENFGENIIAEEFQKGYMYRDSVVRHSMVKVAN
ncbi:nucleotide exchange factor GrpE [Lachnospiraceae bacterium 42-17]